MITERALAGRFRLPWMLCFLSTAVISALGQKAEMPANPGGSAAVLQGDGTVVSHHVVTLSDGKRVSYTARAGFLPLRRDDAQSNGEVLGEMFFVAYTVDRATEPLRPITFVWGGGPGGPSTLSSAGPKRLKPAKNDATASPRYEVADNPDTWLEMTDLVLIDEIGTGYSRVTKPEYAPLFFNEEGDAEAFTEFIRIYMRRYDTRDAPIFLLGESYGSIRGALVSAIANRRGIPVRGVILSANAILLDLENTDLYPPLLLPSFTAAALYHKKLPAELMQDRDKTLREAEAWAQRDYAAALARGSSMSAEERKLVVAQFARYTGLKPDVIEKNNLRVTAEVFGNELLRDEGKIIGHYDSRIAETAPPRAFDPTTDPSLMARADAMPRLMERLYFSHELGVNANLLGSKADSLYLGPFGGAWPPPRPGNVYPRTAVNTKEWMAMRWDANNGFSSYGIPILKMFVDAIESNKKLNVLIAGGRYDLVTPYMAATYLKNRLTPEASQRFTVVTYDRGHMGRSAEYRQEAQMFYEQVLAKPLPPERETPWSRENQ